MLSYVCYRRSLLLHRLVLPIVLSSTVFSIISRPQAHQCSHALRAYVYHNRNSHNVGTRHYPSFIWQLVHGSQMCPPNVPLATGDLVGTSVLSITQPSLTGTLFLISRILPTPCKEPQFSPTLTLFVHT